MCNMACIEFGQKVLNREDIKGKRVIEVGAYDVNGSLRSYIESLEPAAYVGVDIENGYGVDVVCRAEEVRQRFGDQSFDIVVSTEMMEHVFDWRKVCSNIKQLCAAGGIVVITTRSKGFDYHGWPYDFWRFEPEDMELIFSDFTIEFLERDSTVPGVFIMARRPVDFIEKDLSDMELYSIVADRRVKKISDTLLEDFTRKHAAEYRLIERESMKLKVRTLLRNMLWNMKKGLGRKYCKVDRQSE